MKNVLVTGGTGSFGQAFVDRLLTFPEIERIAIYSRGEHAQAEMQRRLADVPASRLSFFIGDVRDGQRLRRAAVGVDTIVHAAALKVVPALEYNPGEGVKTNVLGAMNVIEAALDCSVARVLALSSDKASAPVNLYGATKLCSEKLFTAANDYGGHTTRFSCVRYGNVTGSRGSVVPLWREIAAEGRPLPITDKRMTRFWLTLNDAVELVLTSLGRMRGGEVFIPRAPSYLVTDLAAAISVNGTETVGIRPGEKLHESLIGEHESFIAWDLGDCFALSPWPIVGQDEDIPTRVDDGSQYASDTNTEWLGVDDLRERLLGVAS